ncbi:capsular polysaccharide biosynthsis protein [Klebsiella pneumoniae]|nr:capsular polysaccharide biosynthsis protein [Klebsiella pneumoniae]
MKKLSVLVACFNAEKHIEACLCSLFLQTLSDFEIIIVDDGSSDKTVDIIYSLISGRENVFFFPRELNIGTVKTRNELLKIADSRSEYIAWCDADDVYHKDKLKIQYEFLKKNPDYLGCGSWYRKFGGQNRKVIKFVNPEANRLFTCFGSPVGFPTFVQKNNIGVIFDESLESSEDYAYIGQLAKLGKLTNVKKYLTNYRVHENQESTLNFQRQMQVHKKISNDLCDFFLINKSYLYHYVANPVILDDKELTTFMSLMKSLDSEKDGKLLVAIFDYRFLVFNKKRILFLIKYIFHRNIKLFNLAALYVR